MLAQASASELLYRPINPGFGGNPGNTGYLFGTADRQNKYLDEPEDRASFSNDPADQFVRSLQSRLLSSLASQTVDAIFGENPEESGEIVFGDQTISFNRDLEQVTIQIFDATTGTTTDVTVPVLQVD